MSTFLFKLWSFILIDFILLLVHRPLFYGLIVSFLKLFFHIFFRCFFFFWLRITLLVGYFQVVRVFLVFSFFMDFFPSLCNIFFFFFANCIIWVFSHHQNYRKGIRIKCICIYIYIYIYIYNLIPFSKNFI